MNVRQLPVVSLSVRVSCCSNDWFSLDISLYLFPLFGHPLAAASSFFNLFSFSPRFNGCTRVRSCCNPAVRSVECFGLKSGWFLHAPASSLSTFRFVQRALLSYSIANVRLNETLVELAARVSSKLGWQEFHSRRFRKLLRPSQHLYRI